MFREIVWLGDQSGFGNAKPGVQFMKTFLVATSAVALLATMSIALAQAPKGEGGQKEMSQPPMKEGPSAEKDTPKAGEKRKLLLTRRHSKTRRPKTLQRTPAKTEKRNRPTKKRRTKKRLRMEKRKRQTRTRAAKTLPRKPVAKTRPPRRVRVVRV